MNTRSNAAMMRWFAVGLAVFTQLVDAQEPNLQIENGVTLPRTGAGVAGTTIAGVGRVNGSGQKQFHIFIGGMDGTRFGDALLKVTDANQDGSATPVEIDSLLLAWFAMADTDTNGALSQIELATGLKRYFPMPQPPPGFPAPPEEMAPHNILARHVMTVADLSADGWLTYKEGIAYVTENLSRWDTDSSGGLDGAELETVIAELFAPDDSDRAFLGQGNGVVVRSYRVR